MDQLLSAKKGQKQLRSIGWKLQIPFDENQKASEFWLTTAYKKVGISEDTLSSNLN